jgi:hypothetical protein
MTMRAIEIELPRPSMLAKLGRSPGDQRRYGRSTARLIDDNALVRDFLVGAGLPDQVAWVLYPPHYQSEPTEIIHRPRPSMRRRLAAAMARWLSVI